MTPFFFLVITLAAYRITHFITSDALLDVIRDRITDRWKRNDGNLFAYGLTCSWCIGLIVSAALITGLSQIRSIPLPGIWAAATSTGVGILGQLTHRLDTHD